MMSHTNKADISMYLGLKIYLIYLLCIFTHFTIKIKILIIVFFKHVRVVRAFY